MRTRVASLAILPCVAVAAACSGSTELVLVVDTNLEVPAEMDEVVVSVTGPGGLTVSGSEQLTAAGAPSFPLTLGIRPRGDQLGPIDIAVTGRLAGSFVIERDVQTTLSEGESKVLHVFLVRACLDVSCADGESCGRQGCESVEVTELPSWTGSPPAFDPMDPCFVDPWDPDGDGHGNVACGGDDCDSSEPTVHPGAHEDCDGLDNDCDMVLDPDCGCAPIGAVEGCVTSCGSTGTHECVRGTTPGLPSVWTSCEPPPEACNQVDDDCDGEVDELLPMQVAEARLLHDRVEASAPEVVWAGDRWAVFYGADPDRDGVHMLSLAEDGTAMGAPILVAPGGERPGAAWNGTSFALAYTDPASYCCATDPTTGTCTSSCTRHSLELSILTLDGSPMLSGRELASDIDTSQPPAVIWGDGGISLAYCDRRPYLHRLTATGADREWRQSFTDNGDCPFAVVLDGSRYAGVVSDNEDLLFVEGMFGTWSDPTTPLVAPAGASEPDAVRLVETSAGLVLAFTVNETLSVGAIDPSVPSVPSMAVAASTVVRGGDETFDMASRGDGALVVWSSVDADTRTNDLAFVALDAAGAPIGSEAPLHRSLSRSELPDVAWSGTRFGVAWVEDDSSLWFTTVACE